MEAVTELLVPFCPRKNAFALQPHRFALPALKQSGATYVPFFEYLRLQRMFEER